MDDQANSKTVPMMPQPYQFISDGTPCRFPVLLMHGLGVSAQLFKAGGFQLISEKMRKKGFDAWFFQVPPYQSVQNRSRHWYRHISNVLEKTGATRINLIAFSASGLDARLGLATDWDTKRVAALVTVSTPHQGSSLAGAFCRTDRRLGGLISGRMNAISRRYLPECETDARAALDEVTPESVRPGYESLDPPENVDCFSVSAQAGRGTPAVISPPLIPLNRILYRSEGPNDGFVSAASSLWETSLGTVDADHAQLFGIPFAKRSFDFVAFYLSLGYQLERLGY